MVAKNKTLIMHMHKDGTDSIGDSMAFTPHHGFVIHSRPVQPQNGQEKRKKENNNIPLVGISWYHERLFMGREIMFILTK